MDDALCLLEASQIRVLYADREFVGHAWIQGLACKGIPICVQLRLDTAIDEWPARDWLQILKPGNTGLWVEEVDVCGQPMNVTLTYVQDDEALIIASNAGSVTTIQAGYRKRFRMECLFRALKTKGFKLESTHMTLHDHIELLLCLLTLTYVWCVLVGILKECPLKRHGRRAWSGVTLGLRALVLSLSRKADHDDGAMLTLIRLLELSQTR